MLYTSKFNQITTLASEPIYSIGSKSYFILSKKLLKDKEAIMITCFCKDIKITLAALVF